MKFHTPTPEEFERHRTTCPLEIGRFKIIGDRVEELIGPLPIYEIFTQEGVIDTINLILISSEKKGGTCMSFPKNMLGLEKNIFYQDLPFVVSEDDTMYTKKDEIHYSITQV